MKKIKIVLKNKTAERGSTFIESLIAITILMFVLSGVMTMTTIQMKTNFTQINHTKAVKLVEEALERKMRENFDSMTSEAHTFNKIADFPQYSRTVNVTTVDPDNKDIEVIVTWQERDRAKIPPISMRFRRTR